MREGIGVGRMKLTFEDNLPLFFIVLSLSLGIFLPVIRENEVLRVGWTIIHTIIAVSYITGLVILKAIQDLPTRKKQILDTIKNHANDFQYAWITKDEIGEWYGKLQRIIKGEK